MPWRPIPLDTPVGDLVGRSVVLDGSDASGRPSLMALSPRRSGARVRVRHSGPTTEETGWPVVRHELMPAEAPLGTVALTLGGLDATRAAEVPVHWPKWIDTVVTGVLAVASVVGIVAGVGPGPDVLAGVGLVLGLYVLSTARARHVPRVAPGEVPGAGLRPDPAQVRECLPPAALPGPSPQERVDRVKEAFGALESDIVYRIENSALFDAAVPTTQRFQLALLGWDAEAPDASALAEEVEVSFDEARREAERLGLDHLPQTAREPAGRAARAAATALGTDSTGEREAAARRAAEILAALALYYLPPVDPSAPALIGRRREIAP